MSNTESPSYDRVSFYRFAYSLLFLYLLAGCGRTERNAQAQNGSALTDSTHPTDAVNSATDAAIPNLFDSGLSDEKLYTGPLEKRVKGLSLNNYTFLLNLHSPDWQQGEEHPFLSMPPWKTGGDPKHTLRVPMVAYYDGNTIFPWFHPDVVVQLNPTVIRKAIPPKLLQELQAHSINLIKTPVVAALTTQEYGTPNSLPRGVPLNFFPHVWAHEKINATVNQNFKVLCGFFSAQGVENIGGNAVGFETLKTQDTYIHSNGSGGWAYSPNHFRFQIQKNVEVADFWALTIALEGPQKG